MTITSRIQQRIVETGKSLRQASLDGGLSQEAVSTILRKPENSPTLETVRKLAVGLNTTPEWLAYGIRKQTENGTGENDIVSAVAAPRPGSTDPTPDKRYIQVAADDLRRLVSGALQNENIPVEQADEYADAVLLSIEERAVAHVVHRLEALDRTLPGSPRPKPRGQS